MKENEITTFINWNEVEIKLNINILWKMKILNKQKLEMFPWEQGEVVIRCKTRTEKRLKMSVLLGTEKAKYK